METFGFLIHPVRSLRQDLARKMWFAPVVPERVWEGVVKNRGPLYVSHITGVRSATGMEAEGWFSGVVLSPRQFFSLPVEFVTKKIVDAANLAAERGAKIVGLGALTSVVGDAGISVAAQTKVPVTTGNSYTVWTAVEGARQAAGLMGIDLPAATAAVVGATGSIGRICSQMLSQSVAELILIGRDETKLRPLAESCSGKAKVSCTTDTAGGLARADVVITVTGAVDSVIPAQSLKPGAVVCDVARPRDVSVEVARQRKDVLVIEGGVVEVPGPVDFHFNYGFPQKMTFACMAETMILALEGRYECFSLGRELTLEKVIEISQLAEKHGFKLAGLRSFEEEVTPEHIAQTRERAKQARASGKVPA